MKKLAYLIIPAVMTTAACTTTNERGETVSDRTSTGAIIGAVTGAVVGKQVGDQRGMIVGAVVGGAAGAAIGKTMDKQEEEYRAALRKEEAERQIEVERVRSDVLKLTLSNEVSFDFNSAAIRPGFRPSLNKVADIMVKYPDTRITIVGHTDSIGSEAYNQQLSERRAQSVVDYLVSQGVARTRLTPMGRGETEPKADNKTEAGRRLNRRVEIFLQGQPSA